MQTMSYLASGHRRLPFLHLASRAAAGAQPSCSRSSRVLTLDFHLQVFAYHLYIVLPSVAITSMASEEVRQLLYKFYYPEQ